MDTLQLTRGVTQLDLEMYRYLFDFCDSELLRRLETNTLIIDELSAYKAAILTDVIDGKFVEYLKELDTENKLKF